MYITIDTCIRTQIQCVCIWSYILHQINPKLHHKFAYDFYNLATWMHIPFPAQGDSAMRTQLAMAVPKDSSSTAVQSSSNHELPPCCSFGVVAGFQCRLPTFHKQITVPVPVYIALCGTARSPWSGSSLALLSHLTARHASVRSRPWEMINCVLQLQDQCSRWTSR